MNQDDWVGGVATKAFKDQPNRRASSAAEKAELLLDLGSLISKAPKSIGGMGIVETRLYVIRLEAARKIAAKKNASAQELRSQINVMGVYR